MTIEDALNKIEVNKDLKQIPSQDNVPTSNTTNAENTIKEYIYALDRYNSKNGSCFDNTQFDQNKIALFANRMKFTKDCTPILEPLSKEEFLEIIKAEDLETYKLITQTDFKEYLPEFYNPSIDFLEIKGMFNLNELLHAQELKKFMDLSNIFVIPNLAFLSLFMEEEEKFRKYLGVNGDVKENLAVIESEEESEKSRWNLKYNSPPATFLSRKSLLQFYEITGEKEMKKMFEEITQLLGIFDQIRSVGAQKWNITNLKEKLFERLKKYHPELVYGSDVK